MKGIAIVWDCELCVGVLGMVWYGRRSFRHWNKALSIHFSCVLFLLFFGLVENGVVMLVGGGDGEGFLFCKEE